MNRVTAEYAKAGLCGLITVITIVAIFLGGGPSAYSPGMLALPVVTLLFTGYFCWKAEALKREEH